MKLQLAMIFMMVAIIFMMVALSAAGEVVPGDQTEKDLIQKYWKKHIKSNLPPPTLFMNKASPLSVADSKKYEESAAGENLQSVMSDFCSDARLFCNVSHIFGDAFFYHEFAKQNYEFLEHETLEVPFPGNFFREKHIKEGTIMMMVDIQDMTPERYFLPRSIASKLPFSSSKMGEMKKLWNKLFDEKSLDRMIKHSTYECQRKAARDETKICANSIEAMIDFSTSLLGPNITVRTTENGNGAMENILLGHVKPINEQMKKEASNKENMKCHVKSQRGASSFDLPQVRSSAELAKRYQIKREEGMANLRQKNASATKVEAPSNKQNQPPTSKPLKLSMFATTEKANLNSTKEPNMEPKPKKIISDNASRTHQPNGIAERSVERSSPESLVSKFKIQNSKGQSLVSERTQAKVSKIQNPKDQSLAQGRGPLPTQIQDHPKKQPMKKTTTEVESIKIQQVAKKKSVGNGSSKAKEQLRKRVVSNDESGTKEKPVKRIVVEDESMARHESARKKSKRTHLCPSMLIDDFLKENGKDVEKEIEKLIEDEADTLVEEQENVDCEEAAETNETTKKRTRGPTRCLKTYARPPNKREEVTLDDDGEIIGPDAKTVIGLSNFLGTIARNSDFCPLIYTNFKLLLEKEREKDHLDRRERIWRFVNRYYIIPDEGKKAVFHCINMAWRRYKCDIKKDHFLKYASMKDRLKNRPDSISEDHFKKLLIYWKESKVQAISQKNAVNRSKQKFRHRVGPTNFASIRAKMREKKGGEVSQAEVFVETRKKSRKGKEVDGETQVAIDKLQESIEKSAEAAKETFHSLFGKERSGRVRCHGRTATPSSLRKKEEIALVKKQYDGKIADMSQKMGAMEVLLKNMYMQTNPHLSEEDVDNMISNALLGDGNSPTPRSSTSTYAPAHLKARNENDHNQDDDLYGDQDDDDDLQDDQDDDDQEDVQDDDDLQEDDFHDHDLEHDEYYDDQH